jgi:RHS repeat-associated protein
VTVVPAAGGGSEEIVYVHHDMKGSTVALTEPGGSGPAETYTYSDYGAPQSGTWLAYQYAGYRYDSETGLYYVNARYYNPNLGRFLQADPSGVQGGINLYAYAGNDPVNHVDPTGLTPDGGEFIIKLSETIATFFGGVEGVPSLTVSSTTTIGYKSIVVPNPTQLLGSPDFGSGQCVDLAKAYGAPQTSLWKPGSAIDANTPIGTLVATFYSDNGTKFANQSGLSHVGIFMGETAKGITLIDQYKSRPTIEHSYISYGGTRNYNSNASNYRILLVPGIVNGAQ